MSTLAPLQTGFNANVPRQASVVRPKTSIFGLVVVYALLWPILFIAVRGAFSIQGIGFNTPAAEALSPETGQGSLLHSIELIVCYGVMLLAMFPVIPKLWKVCSDNVALFLLPLWAIISTLWSFAPARSFSFGVTSLILTLFGVYLAVRFTPKQQMQLFVFAGFVAVVLSFLLIVGLPSAGIDYKNTTVGAEGIYPSKNICSNITLIFLLPAFFHQFSGRFGGLKRILYVTLHFLLIGLALARAGWVEMAVVLAVILLLRFIHRLRPLERFLIAGFLPAVVLLLAWGVSANSASILKVLGKDATLSGRTVIWSVVPLAIEKQPLVGFGYDAFFSEANPEAHRLSVAAGDPRLNNAENGVLQLLLDLGIIGLIPLLFLLGRATANGIRCIRRDTPGYAIWYLSILCYTLLSLVDGNKFMFPNSIEWPVFIMAYVGLEVEAKRLRSPGATWT